MATSKQKNNSVTAWYGPPGEFSIKYASDHETDARHANLRLILHRGQDSLSKTQTFFADQFYSIPPIIRAG